MIPELPGLPEFQSVGVPDSRSLNTRMLAMPGMSKVQFTDARQREAAELMNKMRAAYFYSKEANKRSKAVAKAKGRQAQRIAERR